MCVLFHCCIYFVVFVLKMTMLKAITQASTDFNVPGRVLIYAGPTDSGALDEF